MDCAWCGEGEWERGGGAIGGAIVRGGSEEGTGYDDDGAAVAGLEGGGKPIVGGTYGDCVGGSLHATPSASSCTSG